MKPSLLLLWESARPLIFVLEILCFCESGVNLMAKSHRMDPSPPAEPVLWSPAKNGGPLFSLGSLQMVWITSLYGLGFPWDSEQARVVCRFCVVSTLSRYFSFSLLSDNSPFPLVTIRGEQGFVHLHFLYLICYTLVPRASFHSFTHLFHCVPAFFSAPPSLLSHFI